MGLDLHDWLDAVDPVPRWDGDELLAIMNRRGRDEAWRVPLQGEPEPVTTGDTTLSSLSVGSGHVVVTATGDQSPPEVCAVEDGRLRPLTSHGGSWLRRSPAPVVREVDAGGVPAFLFEPPGAGERTAMVLAPHGGPVRLPRPDAGARHLGAGVARLPRPRAQHPRLVRLRAEPGSSRSRASGAAPTPTIS